MEVVKILLWSIIGVGVFVLISLIIIYFRIAKIKKDAANETNKQENK